MWVRTTKYASEQHSFRSHVVGVASRAANFQWAINTWPRMIEERVLVVGSPSWPTVSVDFDLNLLIDAIDRTYDFDLFLWLWCCLLLLLLHRDLHVDRTLNF